MLSREDNPAAKPKKNQGDFVNGLPLEQKAVAP
jgi:hypothetical protein